MKVTDECCHRKCETDGNRNGTRFRLSAWVSNKLIGLIRIYQRGRSMTARGHCRFSPTCSQYAIEAISRYGALRGGLKAVRRIVRCNPLSKGGYDPVR